MTKIPTIVLCATLSTMFGSNVVGATAVTQLDKVANLATATDPNVNVNSYYGSGSNDGGGGTFVKYSPPSCSADGGVVFQGPTGTCYRRQFTGPVHLKWYGVTGVTTADASTALNSALQVAARSER